MPFSIDYHFIYQYDCYDDTLKTNSIKIFSDRLSDNDTVDFDIIQIPNILN